MFGSWLSTRGSVLQYLDAYCVTRNDCIWIRLPTRTQERSPGAVGGGAKKTAAGPPQGPEHRYRVQGGACVAQCQPGFQLRAPDPSVSGDAIAAASECVPCQTPSECPKVCSIHDSIKSIEDAAKLEGCTKLDTDLVITLQLQGTASRALSYFSCFFLLLCSSLMR